MTDFLDVWATQWFNLQNPGQRRSAVENIVALIGKQSFFFLLVLAPAPRCKTGEKRAKNKELLVGPPAALLCPPPFCPLLSPPVPFFLPALKVPIQPSSYTPPFDAFLALPATMTAKREPAVPTLTLMTPSASKLTCKAAGR